LFGSFLALAKTAYYLAKPNATLLYIPPAEAGGKLIFEFLKFCKLKTPASFTLGGVLFLSIVLQIDANCYHIRRLRSKKT